MTNEEKATYIANANQCIDRSGYSSFEECKTSALEMAEWKDHQFKEYLEFQKIECLRTAKILYAYDMSSAGELEIKAKCYDEIINEFFKED